LDSGFHILTCYFYLMIHCFGFVMNVPNHSLVEMFIVNVLTHYFFNCKIYASFLCYNFNAIRQSSTQFIFIPSVTVPTQEAIIILCDSAYTWKPVFLHWPTALKTGIIILSSLGRTWPRHYQQHFDMSDEGCCPIPDVTIQEIYFILLLCRWVTTTNRLTYPLNHTRKVHLHFLPFYMSQSLLEASSSNRYRWVSWERTVPKCNIFTGDRIRIVSKNENRLMWSPSCVSVPPPPYRGYPNAIIFNLI
jgi:hypothetical protein